jgi:hypothetical protein
MLAAGFTRSLTYTCSNTFIGLPGTTVLTPGNADGNINILVSQGISRPLRLWVLAAGSWNNPQYVATSNGGFSTANVKISGSNYFQNPPSTSYEFYEMLKEQFQNKRGLITYSEWQSLYRHHVFDISRIQESFNDPTVSLPITFTGILQDLLPYTAVNTMPNRDLIFIIERAQTIILKMATSTTTITVQ